MVTVQYREEIPYRYDHEYDAYFPILQLRITNAHDADQYVDIDAYLDSGAVRSFFDGWIATAIGLDLLSGERLNHGASSGAQAIGHLHHVLLSHETLGRFPLEVSFSEQPLSRSLLGRDFFNLIQIGFREHHQTLLIDPRP